jgi:hypothetical protein
MLAQHELYGSREMLQVVRCAQRYSYREREKKRRRMPS